ncbi:MAG: ATP-binding cassette domain-containing protein [Burkholderiaceae bacterium]|nr:ATP-binding cassette domain-containing protein [Burkholderiaceae bacterium]
MTKPVILQVNGLRLHFPQRELFADWSTHIPPGLTLVQGAESSGKTTLLRILAGDLAVNAGELRILGISLHDQPAAYKQHVFWVEPRSTAFDQLTPHDYFASVQRMYPRFDPLLLTELTQGLSLSVHLNKALYMLSAGSKRKVWLAAAFASGATVTLLDQPFAALDKASIGCVMALLARAAAHHERAWVMADYEAPGDLLLAEVIDLGTNASNASSGNGRPNR